METKLRAVLASGLAVPVTEVCGELGISRQTFYKYQRRWRPRARRGWWSVLGGRIARRRRSRSSSRTRSCGCARRCRSTTARRRSRITWRVAGWAVPSVATIHRALVRRGHGRRRSPQKRPRTAWRCFEWPRPNDAWQIDATCWVLADGREVWIMDVLDDHSRLLVAARVVRRPDRRGGVGRVLSRRRRVGSARARHDATTAPVSPAGSSPAAKSTSNVTCAPWASHHIRSTPGHPQTCGKLERSHQTTKTWLARQPPPVDDAELQDQLDEWRHLYNHDRPHRGARRRDPARTVVRPPTRYRAGRSDPRTTRRQPPPRPANGTFSWGHHEIGIGADHAGATSSSSPAATTSPSTAPPAWSAASPSTAPAATNQAATHAGRRPHR